MCALFMHVWYFLYNYKCASMLLIYNLTLCFNIHIIISILSFTLLSLLECHLFWICCHEWTTSWKIMLVTDKYTVRQRKQRIKGDNYVLLDEYDSLEKPRYLSTFIVPCTLHLLFMAATAFFVMHVQVSLILTHYV